VMCRVHRIPRSTSVTTAKRPSCKHGTRQEKPGNQTNAKPLFFARGLDDPNQLEVIGEIRFLAQGIFGRIRVAREATRKTIRAKAAVPQTDHASSANAPHARQRWPMVSPHEDGATLAHARDVSW
jgi:hypothetical protein